jgi:AcrR family transcriptional regulator
MSSLRRPSARATDARERLLDAALRCAQQQGYGALSLQSIARQANVSKALVLYHYHDKDELLATLIGWLTSRVIARERSALTASTTTSVLEALWRWLEGELRDGELRLLIELTSERSPAARRALRESTERRHETARMTVVRVFAALELSPRLPASMLATCELAFRDGLVLSAARHNDREARVAFDVFWMSLLSLAQ